VQVHVEVEIVSFWREPQTTSTSKMPN